MPTLGHSQHPGVPEPGVALERATLVRSPERRGQVVPLPGRIAGQERAVLQTEVGLRLHVLARVLSLVAEHVG